MAKTNWQDPETTEIRSTHIAGLQEAVGKLEDAVDLETTTATDVPLTEVYISDSDRYRIYQAAGYRNWLASPAPVIKVNGIEVTSGFTIDYGGGAVIFSPALTEGDIVTASFTYITNQTTKFALSTHASTHATGGSDELTPASIGAETPAGAQAKADTAEANANSYTDTQKADLAGAGRTTETVKGNADDLDAHLAETAQSDDVHGLKTLFQNQQFANLLKNGDFASWSAGDTAAPDGWALDPNGSSVSRVAGIYGKNAASLTNADTYEGYMQVRIIDADVLKQFSGKAVTFAALVKTTVANRVDLYIWEDDGTGYATAKSNYHSGSDSYELLTATKQLRTGLTELVFRLHIESGSVVTADFEKAIAVFGELPAAFANHPNDQHLKAVDYQDSAGTNYEYGLLKIQMGEAIQTASTSSVNVTFPKAFTKFLGGPAAPNTTDICVAVGSTSTTSMTLYARDIAGNYPASDVVLRWIAVGVE